MALPVSNALAIRAMGISETDCKAQSGQVTENLRMGSLMSFPLARIDSTNYRRGTARWVDKEMKRSLQFALRRPEP
jgi:hypothetical protein